MIFLGCFQEIFIRLQRCLQNMIKVTVRQRNEEKSYRLEDLLELQNKLMLMSSKGEHGREQVDRFTEVSVFLWKKLL